MAIKRIMGKGYKKYKKCLRCNVPIEAVLRDCTVYTCPGCGQGHYVDIYRTSMAITILERPDVRKRHKGAVTPEQEIARAQLIERVEMRKMKAKQK